MRHIYVHLTNSTISVSLLSEQIVYVHVHGTTVDTPIPCIKRKVSLPTKLHIIAPAGKNLHLQISFFINHVEVTFKFLFSVFNIKCYQNIITHCVTTNGMNHTTGLYINRPIWQKTKPSKPSTSFIFKIIWNVTSDSRMNQKISLT
jgi:hypothetical protein